MWFATTFSGSWSLSSLAKRFFAESSLTGHPSVIIATGNRGLRFGSAGLLKRKENHMSSVNHPSHYNQGTMEVIDAIEGLDLDFNAGNVLKYIARYKFKDSPLEDLKKAQWYLSRIIRNEELRLRKAHENGINRPDT
jgi:hypothetical protein